MKRVIFDTNFLVDLCRFRIDMDELDNIVEEPFELCTLESVIKELEKLGTKEAKVALKLIEAENIKILKFGMANTDNALVELAKTNDVIVATNDRELRKRLGKAIYIRAKKHLGIG